MGGTWIVIDAVAALAVLVVASVLVRRLLLARAGSIDMCWRLRLRPDGGSWYLGAGKFHGAELQLYRSFSLLPVPNRRVRRSELNLAGRRSPAGTERELLPAGSVILEADVEGKPMELAMSPDAATGLLAWLESVPPSDRATDRMRRAG